MAKGDDNYFAGVDLCIDKGSIVKTLKDESFSKNYGWGCATQLMKLAYLLKQYRSLSKSIMSPKRKS